MLFKRLYQKMLVGLVIINLISDNCPHVLAEINLTVIEDQTIAQVISINELSDVSINDFYFQELQDLIDKYGIIVGYPDGTFRGYQNLTREEFVNYLSITLINLAQFDIFLTQPCANIPEEIFMIRDVLPTEYTFEAVRNLVEGYGVNLLYEDQTFRGDQDINNQELSRYLNQTFGLNYPVNLPIKPVTRGEFVVILDQILNEIMATQIENL